MSDETRNGMESLWTDEDVAAYLRVSVATIQKWAKLGKIPVRKAGSLNRFNRDEVEAWTREGRRPVEEPTEESAA